APLSSSNNPSGSPTMKSWSTMLWRALSLPLCALALVLAAAPAGSQPGATRYLLTEISGEGDRTFATSVWTDPDTGDWYAAGLLSPPYNAPTRAVLWRNGQMTDLGNLGASVQDVTLKVINGEPVVVGSSHTGPPSYQTRAFVWRNGELSMLPNADRATCRAADIGADGTIVGTSQPSIGINSATLWIDGHLSDLEQEPYYSNLANAIDGDCIAGARARHYSGPRQAALWQGGKRTDLGSLGGDLSLAKDVALVDGLPSVVGEAALPNTSRMHAFRWRNGAMTDLGTLGGEQSAAQAINHRGQIVGSADDPSYQQRAAIWENGAAANLNDLVLNGADIVLYGAHAIDDSGVILAAGRRSGEAEAHTYLLRLVTVTEPPPVITAVNPTGGKQGDTVNVLIAGTGFTPTSTVDFGPGITVNSVSYALGSPEVATYLTVNLRIAGDADLGGRSVRVTNPDLQWESAEHAFTVQEGPTALQSFTLGQNLTVRGGRRLMGSARVSRPAPGPRGATIVFSSSNPAIKPPKKLRTPAGFTMVRKPFFYTTKKVRTQTSYTVTATYGGVSRSVEITLLPR
ncbi:MAG: hypothetical protein ACO1SX_15400, partial [Actinomycetota bacterium]